MMTISKSALKRYVMSVDYDRWWGNSKTDGVWLWLVSSTIEKIGAITSWSWKKIHGSLWSSQRYYLPEKWKACSLCGTATCLRRSVSHQPWQMRLGVGTPIIIDRQEDVVWSGEQSCVHLLGEAVLLEKWLFIKVVAFDVSSSVSEHALLPTGETRM